MAILGSLNLIPNSYSATTAKINTASLDTKLEQPVAASQSSKLLSTSFISTNLQKNTNSIPLVTTLVGKSFDIGADKGFKVVYFYSNSCPCVRNCETLTYKPLSQQYKGKVNFYAVVSGGWDLHDDRSNFLALLATHHLPFDVYLDQSHAVADALGGRAASQAVLLSPDNQVLYNGAADDSKQFTDTNGHLGLTKTYLADAIAEALAGKPILVPFVAPRGCSISK